jgi:4-diphosphocytidyl-2-C-methyl-D-erythritol kinase
MSATDDTRTAEAPAKLNPFLRVLGRRVDGYHDIETLILPISLADRMTIHAAAGDAFRTLSVELEVTGEPVAVAGVPVDDSNLVLRAAALLATRGAVRGFAEIALEKHVPPQAGLGGGSSDAARTLRLLNGLWGSPLDPASLEELAAELGSDVPALLAEAPVMVRGRGEVVEPVAVGGPLRWIVQPFSFGVSTADAYRWWDEGGFTGPEGADLLEALARPEPDPATIGPLLHNDLEEPVLRRHEAIARARDVLAAAGVTGTVLCGSGSSLAGLLPADIQALPTEAEDELLALTGRPPLVATSGPS